MWRVVYLETFETFAFEYEGRCEFDTQEEAEEALSACRREHGNGRIEFISRRMYVD